MAVAKAAGVCPRTVRKWVARYQREGLAGLQDRSSRPHRLRRPTPKAVVVEIERLRRQRWTGKQIAAETGAFAKSSPGPTQKTNGKAERFIQTALREWACAHAYHNSQQRSAELFHWVHRYNWHRPHGSLKAKTPISRLGLSEDNLLRLHS